MQLSNVVARARGKARRMLASGLARRTVPLGEAGPIISFTFDDAPKTAFDAGRRILARHGARATYFVSLALIDTETEVGRIGSPADLKSAVADGCELGCHTYDHLDAWHVSTATYLVSIERNREALERMLPGARFDSFAYPKSGATLAVKAGLGPRFKGARGGGQAANLGTADLNLVKACFLDRRAGVDMALVRALVDETVRGRGWLVFATHDIAADPSPYGCTPEFLEAVAECSRRSGALLLPFAEACGVIQPRGAEGTERASAGVG
ncbi:MAG: polysaccharide deacetylase family protein [Hyphomicrobium sp.]|uniref:polysaccharide deacetylase family protein n=1 Tax=Hyphomicrobium sp. TaxID=82 RepID=UPI003D0B72E5